MRDFNKTYFFAIVLVSVILTACQPQTHEPDIEKALSDLTARFVQLPKDKANQSGFYKLIRTVTIGEKNIQIQLRLTPDSILDRQEVIIIINPQGNYFAIPFFSNTYRDYWNFEFDNIALAGKKANTTFEKEFVKAIDTLNLNDTSGTGRLIFSEIFFSLIHCDIVSENDSSHFSSFSAKNSYPYKIPNENYDSCDARIRRNFEAIRREINSQKNFYNCNVYWDAFNDRIYQFSDENKRQQKFKVQMKVYRQDCATEVIDSYPYQQPKP